jgi:1,4-dihydroxy-6-naphthoate synthase
MSNKFDKTTIRKFDDYLQASIQYGLEHQDETLQYAMKYSRGKPADLIKKFVKMYVNDVTVEMGNAGEAAIRKMFELAVKQNLIAPFEIKISQRS